MAFPIILMLFFRLYDFRQMQTTEIVLFAKSLRFSKSIIG